MFPWPLLAGLFQGWALGANDAANAFGTAVAARIVTYRRACLLCAIAVIAGAYFQGLAGIETYRDLAAFDQKTVLVATLSAALAVTAMTIWGIPISTSQAIVGAIAGVAIPTHSMNWGGLEKVVLCWITAPLGGLVGAYLLYFLVGWLLTKLPMGILTRDKLLWGGLILVGIYGSYALGANNVANAVGLFSGQFAGWGITDKDLCLYGGIAIALGAVTYGQKVMRTVGSDIMPLDAFTGFVAVFSMSVMAHIFAVVGVPVSLSQCLVGAVIGVGCAKQTPALSFKCVGRILAGWALAPVVALVLSAAGYSLFCL